MEKFPIPKITPEEIRLAVLPVLSLILLVGNSHELAQLISTYNGDDMANVNFGISVTGTAVSIYALRESILNINEIISQR